MTLELVIWNEFDAEEKQCFTVHAYGKEDLALFKELIRRGANVWDRAPPQIKAFVDMVTVGEVQQDYYAQENIPRPAV